MSSSRPSPGPMTREWRWVSMAMTGVATLEAEVEEGVSRMMGWTIKFGE